MPARPLARRELRRRAWILGPIAALATLALVSPAGAATTTTGVGSTASGATTTTRAAGATSTSTTTPPATPLAFACHAATTGAPTTTTGGTSGVSGSGRTGTSGTSSTTKATSGASGSVTSTSTTTTTTTSLPPRGSTSAYYLFESNGAVAAYGGATVYGSESAHPLHTTIVGGAEKPGGGGYWMLSARGNLFNFGSALDYGTPVHRPHRGSFVAMAVTPDGAGFYVLTSTGSIFPYGNAPFCGSPVHQTPHGTIAGIVDMPQGNGYWVYSTGGNLYAYGDAHTYGAGAGPHGSPVVGMAATPDGLGYWLAYADGAVRQFGDAHFFGSAVHIRLAAAISGFGATSDGGGYFLVGRTGRLYQFGDAKFAGSLARTPPKAPVTVTALIVAAFPPAITPPPVTPPPVTPPPLTGDPYLHGSLGFDISNFQCAKPGSTSAMAKLPTATGFGVVQVVGWLDSSQNSCLGAEVAWATAAAPTNPIALYIFVNSPGQNGASLAQSATGPAGTCANVATTVQAACRAYNYGYNGAANAWAYAASQHVSSPLWWIDIENASLAPGQYSNFSAGQYWSASTALNDQTIQGTIDALRKQGAVVGIYSTSLQYPKIAGNYVPRGPRVPLWIAGAPWTNPPYTEKGLPAATVLAAWCAGTAQYAGAAGTDLFAGGIPWLLQETPGNLPSPFGIDPNYAC